MNGINKVTLLGNVGKEPDVKHLPNATVAQFSLATTESYKKKGEQEWTEETSWHNIVCWRNQADTVEKYIKKGSLVYIEGKIKQRSWDDKDGQKKYITEIVVDRIIPLAKLKEKDDVTSQNAPLDTAEVIPPPTESDDLPF